MKKIPTNSIEDGLILAEAIKGASGHILLPKGQEVKKSLIQRLIGWGVDFVTIESQDGDSEVENGNSEQFSTPEEMLKHIQSLYIEPKLSHFEKQLMNSIANARMEKT
jgi:hypothetical protein